MTARKKRGHKRESGTARLVDHIPLFVLASFTLLAVVAIFVRAGAAALPPSIPMLVLLAITVVDRMVDRTGGRRP
jgi:hypothetical protein